LAIFRVPNILVVGYINFKSQKLYMSLIRRIRYQLAWDTTNILVVGYINFESQKLYMSLIHKIRYQLAWDTTNIFSGGGERFFRGA